MKFKVQSYQLSIASGAEAKPFEVLLLTVLVTSSLKEELDLSV